MDEDDDRRGGREPALAGGVVEDGRPSSVAFEAARRSDDSPDVVVEGGADEEEGAAAAAAVEEEEEAVVADEGDDAGSDEGARIEGGVRASAVEPGSVADASPKAIDVADSDADAGAGTDARADADDPDTDTDGGVEEDFGAREREEEEGDGRGDDVDDAAAGSEEGEEGEQDKAAFLSRWSNYLGVVRVDPSERDDDGVGAEGEEGGEDDADAAAEDVPPAAGDPAAERARPAAAGGDVEGAAAPARAEDERDAEASSRPDDDEGDDAGGEEEDVDSASTVDVEEARPVGAGDLVGPSSSSGGASKGWTAREEALDETMDVSFDDGGDDEEVPSANFDRGEGDDDDAAASKYARSFRWRVAAAGAIVATGVLLVGLGLGLRPSNDGPTGAANAAGGYAVPSPTDDPSDAPSDAPSRSPTEAPARSPSAAPSGMASAVPSFSLRPSRLPSSAPTPSPSDVPSALPSGHPAARPSLRPSADPTAPPSGSARPSGAPSASPTPFVPGDLAVTDWDLGIRHSTGLNVKRIARTGEQVRFDDGGRSAERWHSHMDGAGVTTMPDGGYVYVSNRTANGALPLNGERWIRLSPLTLRCTLTSFSEDYQGRGGVYGLYFNKYGEVVDYKTLLSGTTWNCGGGISPWNTWISCEEHPSGQCWQVDPNPNSPNHNSPKATLLGGSYGGKFESVVRIRYVCSLLGCDVQNASHGLGHLCFFRIPLLQAVDNRNPDRPVFFTTEDDALGALRRFEADGRGWDALHAPANGKTTFLRILDGSRYEWTADHNAARISAAAYYGNSEGVSYHDGILYFVAKVTHKLLILDLRKMTYKSERTTFNAQPDQILMESYKRWIYFSEDGGNRPGVHVRDKETGTYLTLFEGLSYKKDETVGIALSPDRKKFFAGFQDAGLLMEFTRDDGMAFQ
ncbi:hypothetical protein ACHAWF_018366 [Thalassiosira exigua]